MTGGRLLRYKLAVALVTALACFSSAGAQSAEPVRRADGQLVSGWQEKTACLGVQGMCLEVISNARTGEIASLNGLPAPGFALSDNGKEIVRSAEHLLQSQTRSDLENLARARQAPAAKGVTSTCVGEGGCPAIVIDPGTHAILSIDGRLLAYGDQRDR
jgi:hypothetical protein